MGGGQDRRQDNGPLSHGRRPLVTAAGFAPALGRRPVWVDARDGARPRPGTRDQPPARTATKLVVSRTRINSITTSPFL